MLTWILKPLASTSFLVVAIANGALESAYGQAVFAALLLGFIGDVLLIPSSKTAFLLGLISFLLGHIAFCTAFLIRGVSPSWIAGAAVPLTVAVIFVLRWLIPHVEKKMKAPVFVYAAVISMMVILATGVYGHSGNRLIPAGAVMFYLSDLSVARDRFVKPGAMNRLWGLPLYYAAQLILALTVGVP